MDTPIQTPPQDLRQPEPAAAGPAVATPAAASPAPPAVVLVSATRSTQAEFVQSAWLARSLRRVASGAALRLRLFPGNSRPLPDCYNQALDEAADDDLLVFVHDDAHVDDWMLGQRLHDALQRFDVVGVAGNTRRLPMQLAWYLMPAQPGGRNQVVLSEPDRAHLSGAVAHGEPGQSQVTVFGPAPQAVAVLDGVLLAARAGRLRQAGVRFDPQFAFHFYDLDFCRSAQAAGLRLGTRPLAITHASRGGSIQSEAWQTSARRYLAKWGD